jgi:predicted small lipoprotein YifL
MNFIMKKTALALILIGTLLVITACGNKPEVKSNNVASTASNNVESNETDSMNNQAPNGTNEIDGPNTTNDNSDTITDIASWNHPVKYVFNNANITVIKVAFKNNKTYPIFYVNLSKDLNDENETYYKNLVNQVATANGYWDYEIIDENKNVDIKVTCDRNNGKVNDATNNGNDAYFTNANSNEETNIDNEMVQYLEDNVSEVKSFIQLLQSNNNGVKGIVYVEREPDPNSSNTYLKNYYGMYVGESYPDHNVNIYRFAINKDTKEILYYDVVNDKYESLSDWRNSK